MTFNPYLDFEKDDQIKIKSNKINTLINSVFDNDQGKALLGLLEAVTIQRPVLPPDQPSYYGYFREGQNDIIRQILKAMKYKEEEEISSTFLAEIRSKFKKFILLAKKD